MMASLANGGSADDIAPGVDFFAQAEGGRQLPAGRPDLGDDRVRPDPGRHRLGLPERRRDRQARRRWKVVVPEDAVVARLLLPGDQRGRPAPGGRPAVGGVPLQRRGPEPLARRRRPPGPRPTRWSKAGTIDKADVRRPARGHRHAGDPDRRADREDGGVPRGQLGQGRRLSTTAPAATATAAPPAPTGRRLASARRSGCCRSCSTSRSSCSIPTITVVVGAFQDEDGRLHARATSARSVATTALARAAAEPACSSASSAAGRRRARRAAGLPGRHRAARPACCAARSPRVCGVLAQFGGVTLAFAFIATLGFAGLLTDRARATPSASTPTGSGWLYELPGLIARLHLLPDPADGDRLPAGARGAAAAVARGRGQPRRHHLAVLAPGRRSRCCGRPSWARCCCCSPTRSRRTPPPRRWSARAARSCRC